ncbi:hypothetical protein THAOC_06934, partial [Thalassiosira oceanica]
GRRPAAPRGPVPGAAGHPRGAVVHSPPPAPPSAPPQAGRDDVVSSSVLDGHVAPDEAHVRRRASASPARRGHAAAAVALPSWGRVPPPPGVPRVVPEPLAAPPLVVAMTVRVAVAFSAPSAPVVVIVVPRGEAAAGAVAPDAAASASPGHDVLVSSTGECDGGCLRLLNEVHHRSSHHRSRRLISPSSKPRAVSI